MVLGSQFLCAYFKVQYHHGVAYVGCGKICKLDYFIFLSLGNRCMDAQILKTSCALDGKGNNKLGAAGLY